MSWTFFRIQTKSFPYNFIPDSSFPIWPLSIQDHPARNDYIFFIVEWLDVEEGVLPVHANRRGNEMHAGQEIHCGLQVMIVYIWFMWVCLCYAWSSMVGGFGLILLSSSMAWFRVCHGPTSEPSTLLSAVPSQESGWKFCDKFFLGDEFKYSMNLMTLHLH